MEFLTLAPRAAVAKATRAASTCIALGVLAASAPGAWALTDKEEAALGQGMNAAVAARMGGVLPASHPMAQRVEKIGRRFAKLARPRGFPYRYQVLKSDSVLNAFAAPGGTIFITTRLVKFARSDDELASILGHETAHVSQRHIAQEMDDRNAFVKFGQRLSELRHEAAQSSPNAAKSAPKTKGASVSPSVSPNNTPLMPTLTWWLLSRGRSRSLESEADAVSARWMKRLGYDPRAAITLLQHAGSAAPRSSSPLASILASHPGMPERVVALRELIEREKLDTKPAPKPKASTPKPPAPTQSAPLNPAPTTASADVAAAAAAGQAPPAKPDGAPVAP